MPILYADTDIVGTTKSIKLSLQRPLVRAIIQDSIENLRALVLFNNAFPDSVLSFNLAKGALIIAAENRKADGALVLHRLQDDADYLAKLSILVR